MSPRPKLPVLPPLILCACGRRAQLELTWWHTGTTLPAITGREKVCYPCLAKRVAHEANASPCGVDYVYEELEVRHG